MPGLFGLRLRGVVEDAPGATIPATQSINLGAKTRRGHGGHDLANTGGALTITSDPSGFFAIDTHNKLVLGGVFGNAPPTLTGPYTVVVSNGIDSSTVTVNIVANLYHVTNIDSGTNADTASVHQLKTVMGLRALGDGIRFRDGSVYNAPEPVVTSGASTWTLTSSNTAVVAAFTGQTVGVLNADDTVSSNIADNLWTKIDSDTPFGATMRRVYLYGSSDKIFGLWFYKLNFHREYVATDFVSNDAGLVMGDGTTTRYVGYVRATECDFWSTDNTVNPTDVISGVYGALGTHSILLEECTFNGLYDGVQIGSTRGSASLASIDSDIWVYNCTFRNIWNDNRTFRDAAPIWTTFCDDSDNRCFDASQHKDAEQRLFTSTLVAGTYPWGVYSCNRAWRGDATTGFLDFQNGPFQTTQTSTSTFTGARVSGNAYCGTGGRLATLSYCTAPVIKFNTGVKDQTVGVTTPSTPNFPQIHLYACTDAEVDYNISAGISLESGSTLASNTGNVTQATTTPYPSDFDNPIFGASITSGAVFEAAYRWKINGAADPAVSGNPYQAGAFTDYVDFDTPAANFPF